MVTLSSDSSDIIFPLITTFTYNSAEESFSAWGWIQCKCTLLTAICFTTLLPFSFGRKEQGYYEERGEGGEMEREGGRLEIWKRGMSKRVRDGEKGRDLGKLEKEARKERRKAISAVKGFMAKRMEWFCAMAGCWGAVHGSGGEKNSGVFG